jgi:hypothetical protein
MKNQVSQIVGKTITAVLMLEAKSYPQDQVMLVFDDGTHYEFYGNDIHNTGGLNQGGLHEVWDYVRANQRAVLLEAKLVKGEVIFRRPAALEE